MCRIYYMLLLLSLYSSCIYCSDVNVNVDVDMDMDMNVINGDVLLTADRTEQGWNRYVNPLISLYKANPSKYSNEQSAIALYNERIAAIEAAEAAYNTTLNTAEHIKRALRYEHEHIQLKDKRWVECKSESDCDKVDKRLTCVGAVAGLFWGIGAQYGYCDLVIFRTNDKAKRAIYSQSQKAQLNEYCSKTPRAGKFHRTKVTTVGRDIASTVFDDAFEFDVTAENMQCDTGLECIKNQCVKNDSPWLHMNRFAYLMKYVVPTIRQDIPAPSTTEEATASLAIVKNALWAYTSPYDTFEMDNWFRVNEVYRFALYVLKHTHKSIHSALVANATAWKAQEFSSSNQVAHDFITPDADQLRVEGAIDPETVEATPTPNVTPVIGSSSPTTTTPQQQTTAKKYMMFRSMSSAVQEYHSHVNELISSAYAQQSLTEADATVENCITAVDEAEQLKVKQRHWFLALLYFVFISLPYHIAEFIVYGAYYTGVFVYRFGKFVYNFSVGFLNAIRYAAAAAVKVIKFSWWLITRPIMWPIHAAKWVAKKMSKKYMF